MRSYTFETIIVFLLLVWYCGAFVSPFGGSWIHLLLVAVLVAVVYRVGRGLTAS